MLRAALELPGPSTIRVPQDARRATWTRARWAAGSRRASCAPATGRCASSAWARWSAACLEAADELAAEGIDATVWDVRVVSPPDAAMLADAARHRLVVTVEDGVRHGGAGAFLVDAMAAAGRVGRPPGPATRVLGVPRQFLAQGKADDILASLGLDGAGIAESVRRVTARRSRPAEAEHSTVDGSALRSGWRRSVARSR